MNKGEEQDDLWQLLGRAKQPVVSPFFARNVLREIRQDRRGENGVFSWLRMHLRMVSLGATAVVLLTINGVLFVGQKHEATPIREAVAKNVPVKADAQIATAKDAEVINHLDELLAYEKNSIWLDDSEN